MSANIEAWVIYAESPGEVPRETDNPLFPWAWGEAMAVLPGDATPSERAAALAVAGQMTHYAGGDRSDALQFMDRESYASGLARQEYLDALHPYLGISPARNVRYSEPEPGEARGRITFDIIPASER